MSLITTASVWTNEDNQKKRTPTMRRTIKLKPNLIEHKFSIKLILKLNGGYKYFMVLRTRTMLSQSQNVGNISLIYKNPKNGFDFQLAGVYTGERISFVSPYAGLNYWQSPITQLDLSFEKKIGKHFSFYGKINNLTDAPLELSLHQSYNTYMSASGSRSLALQTDPNNRIIIQKDFYRTTYLFGIRYKL